MNTSHSAIAAGLGPASLRGEGPFIPEQMLLGTRDVMRSMPAGRTGKHGSRPRSGRGRVKCGSRESKPKGSSQTKEWKSAKSSTGLADA